MGEAVDTVGEVVARGRGPAPAAAAVARAPARGIAAAADTARRVLHAANLQDRRKAIRDPVPAPGHVRAAALVQASAVR